MAARSVETDVVVVGGGPAGLMAAVTARRRGLEVLLLEADEVLGGSGGADDGVLWLPGVAVGERGPGMAGEAYLKALYGTDDDRRSAFLSTAPTLHRELASLGAPLDLVRGEPDSHPEEAGGRRSGRVFQPRATVRRRLGRRADQVRLGSGTTTFSERRRLFTMSRNLRSVATTVKAVGGRGFLGRLVGCEPAVGGSALLVALAARATSSGVTVWRHCPLVRLEEGTPPRVVVHRDSADLTVVARRGVVLATGGFSRDDALRRRHLGAAADPAWSLAAPLVAGRGLSAAEALGAGTTGFGGAEWRVGMRLKDGSFHPVDLERCQPWSIIVDATGTRFTNEALPAVELGRVMLARTQQVPATPAYLIIDSSHRSRFPLGPWPPQLLPATALPDGDIARADTVMDLAGELGIDKAGLVGTVARFNSFAKKGKDDDFRRGASARDKAHGLPFHRRNRSLGPVETPPYYGVRLYPADLSTRGGLLTDGDGRVLTDDDTPIEGLYAVGSVAASPWGDLEPGPGAGLAAALVAAYRAASHLGG